MSRRTALVTGAGTYVGPALCRLLAQRNHDLVLSTPAPGQAEELRTLGAEVLVVDDPAANDTSPSGWQVISQILASRHNPIDCAALFPPPIAGQGVTVGPLLAADSHQLGEMTGYLHTTLWALQAVIPLLRKPGGQVVVFTSDAGVRPVANWSLYGAARAAQSFMIRAAALEHAAEGIAINVIGSKNAVFTGFPGAPAESISDHQVTTGPWARHLEEETPLGRLGTMAELAAFATVLLDGSNRFQTAQYFSFSGGWHAL